MGNVGLFLTLSVVDIHIFFYEVSAFHGVFECHRRIKSARYTLDGVRRYVFCRLTRFAAQRRDKRSQSAEFHCRAVKDMRRYMDFQRFQCCQHIGIRHRGGMRDFFCYLVQRHIGATKYSCAKTDGFLAFYPKVSLDFVIKHGE